MARSLIRQLEQILNTTVYDDSVSGVNGSDVSEPSVSGTLQDDLNIIRTLVKDTKGTSYWYSGLGSYFDPTNTTSGGAENKAVSLSNMAGNTLDSKTIIMAVEDDNSGSGYTVSGTSTGALVSVTTAYATPTSRVGLPVYASTANTGSYHDEGGMDRVCRVDVVDLSADGEMQTNAGHTIYAKMHDAADFSGTGTGTDVYMRLYANDSVTDLSTVSGGAPSSIKFVYPHRKLLSAMSEYDWLRTDFISSWEGDVELIEDIQNIWAFTGASNDDGSAQPWDHATGNYMLAADPDNLKDAIDDINSGIGDETYATGTYVTSNEGITNSIEALDAQLKTVTDGLSSSSGDKLVESVSSTISANVEHPLPGSNTYTPDATSGSEGSNMDVYVGGQMLAADTGAAGANADRDYGETSTSGITFRFEIQTDRNITYMVRQ